MLQLRWSRVTAVGIFLLALFVVLLDATGTTTNKKKDVKIRNKREGSWSGWSVWSPCSRSCGGGIRTQTRQCQIRRGRGVKSKEKDGGALIEEFKLWKNVSSRHCEGHATRHHVCNIQECPKGSIDFRESQCKAFDNRPFMGKVYRWEAFIDERSPCSLTCRAKGFRFFATLNKSVVDGTDCKSSPFDLQVCITGICTKAMDRRETLLTGEGPGLEVEERDTSPVLENVPEVIPLRNYFDSDAEFLNFDTMPTSPKKEPPSPSNSSEYDTTNDDSFSSDPTYQKILVDFARAEHDAKMKIHDAKFDFEIKKLKMTTDHHNLQMEILHLQKEKLMSKVD